MVSAAPAAAAPANDNFANALSVEGPATVSGSNVGATGELGEPNHAGESEPLASVWINWTATRNGFVVFDACGPGTDYSGAVLSIYTGASVDSLTLVQDADRIWGIDCSGQPWTSIVDATAGTTYRLAIDGVGAAEGNFTLKIIGQPPAHDAFSRALVLTGVFASATGQVNTQASAELGEPWHAGEPPAHSLWYTWTAPAAGPTTIDTCDGSFDTVLAVYTGDVLGGLTPIASDDDSCIRAGGSFAEFTAQTGQTYRIAVDGYDGDSGIFDLYVEGTEPPPPPPPPPAPPPPVIPADITAPALAVGGATTQRILRQRAVIVVATAGEACAATAKGKVSIRGAAKPFKLTPVTKQIAKGKTAILKLRLTKTALRAIARALKARKRASATVTVTARDAAGNVTTKRRMIRLKR
jgi:hypothetical protein